jgi:hypothetical protein
MCFSGRCVGHPDVFRLDLGGGIPIIGSFVRHGPLSGVTITSLAFITLWGTVSVAEIAVQQVVRRRQRPW